MSPNRIRVLLVSLLAVLAVSAVASASASAHNYTICRETGTEYTEHLCKTHGASGPFAILPVAGTEVYKVTSTSGVTKFEAELLKVRVIIECKKDTDTGEIEKEGKAKDNVIVYEECELFQVVKHVKEHLTACTVPTITTAALKGLLITGKGIGPEEELEPESGTSFATITISGASCALASKETVTGKQICQLPEAIVEKETHELECSPSGGALVFDKAAASYYGTDILKLTNGAAWDAE